MKRRFKTGTDDLRWGWKAAILILGTVLFGILLHAVVIWRFRPAAAIDIKEEEDNVFIRS